MTIVSVFIIFSSKPKSFFFLFPFPFPFFLLRQALSLFLAILEVCVDQASLELRRSACHCLQSAIVRGVSHQAQPLFPFCFLLVIYFSGTALDRQSTMLSEHSKSGSFLFLALMNSRSLQHFLIENRGSSQMCSSKKPRPAEKGHILYKRGCLMLS